MAYATNSGARENPSIYTLIKVNLVVPANNMGFSKKEDVGAELS